jgi:hypothetical protein
VFPQVVEFNKEMIGEPITALEVDLARLGAASPVVTCEFIRASQRGCFH